MKADEHRSILPQQRIRPTNGPRINASSAEAWTTCKRAVWFDYHPPEGLEIEEDRFDTITKEFAEEHEKRVLASLGPYVEATSVAHTKELMAQGVPVIYQPAFVDNEDGIFGRPDFLLRNGSGEYQVGDAKLALSTDGSDKKHIRIQLGVYRKLLGNGEPAVAFLGSGEKEEVGEESEKEAEKFLESMKELISSDTPTEVFYAETRCGKCPYRELCIEDFKKKCCVSLLYGIQGRSVPKLQEEGIRTISDLASRDPASIGNIPYLSENGKARAVMQARSQLNGEIIQLGPVVLPEGPSIHFDVEADPFPNAYKQQVYLWGLLPPPHDKSSFEYTWSDGSAEQDKDAWFQFLNKVAGYKNQYPGFKLVHFSHYERTQIATYAERYGENEAASWLLSDDSPLFDIQKSSILQKQ